MTVTEITSKRGKSADDPVPSLAAPASVAPVRRRRRILPVLVTLATVALAALLGWGM
jgi:hypothetical protein